MPKKNFLGIFFSISKKINLSFKRDFPAVNSRVNPSGRTSTTNGVARDNSFF
jgi:hypothetical protein